MGGLGYSRERADFERIAARLGLSLQVARLAGNPAKIFELVERGLDLGPGRTPVLQLQILELGRAVALRQMRLDLKVRFPEAPGVAVPVHPCPAHAMARQEAAIIAHGQRGLRQTVAHGHRFDRRRQEQILADGVAQLVLHIADVEIGGCVAPWPALDRHDIQARRGELFAENGAGPAQPHDHDIFLGKHTRHDQPSIP